MNSFDRQMALHQIEWRERTGNSGAKGSQNGREYDHILPKKEWGRGLWPGVVDRLNFYLGPGTVQPHTGVHNLKSSWILCANLYFPFGQDAEGRGLLAGFLHNHVDSEITTVDRIELEHAEKDALSPAQLLGETGGNRGSGQTSPDLGIVANDGRALLLVENKFTEHSFYPCSARRTTSSSEREANPDRSRCLNAGALRSSHGEHCHQSAWGRKYWEILADAVDEERLAALPACPAAHTGYQLFRQQALAEGIARSGSYDTVISAVAYDDRNAALKGSLRRQGLDDLSAWGSLFRGRARFRAFTHQAWVAWVSAQDGARWDDWLHYVRERYGLSAT